MTPTTTAKNTAPGGARDQQPPLDRRPPAPPPDHHPDRDQQRDQVREGQPDREADRHLPRGDGPRAEQRPGPPQPDPAHCQRQRQRDPSARDHLHVAVLLHAEGRVGEGGSRDRRPGGAEAHLARQQIGPEEAERVDEEEEQVVADDRGLGPVADQAGRRVADQRVAERERVGLGPELVRLEEVERLGGQRVASPRHLPGLRQRVAEVLGDRVGQVQRQRPVHDHRDREGSERREQDLAAGNRAGGDQARSGRSGCNSSIVTRAR